MSENKRYVRKKNSGKKKKKKYEMRMSEEMLNGVKEIRIKNVDGNNRYNRDGMIENKLMMGRRGD